MHQIRAPGHHFGDAVLLAEEVTGGFDAVTAKIVKGAAAGVIHVPEMRAVRAAVAFSRTHPQHFADAAAVDGGFRLHHGGREDFRLGVAVDGAGITGRFVHQAGFGGVATQRLGADLISSRRGERERHRQMLFIGQRDDEQIDSSRIMTCWALVYDGMAQRSANCRARSMERE